jgi:DNA polymerase I-like protein with 3'-5' exonuclease and polymerase domains
VSKRKIKSYHVGGQQLPLLTPDSAWRGPGALPDLRRCGVIALDRECRDEGLAGGRGPGWAFGAGRVIGVSVAWEEGHEIRSTYAPIAHPDSECFDADAVRRWETDHQKAGVRFVMMNAPYDVGWGAHMGVPVPEKIDDVGAMAYLVDETLLEINLDALCRWRGLPGKNETLLREAAAAYHVDPKKEMWKLPARYVGPYAEDDAVCTLRLLRSLEPEIRAQELEAAYRLEMDLVPMVHEMRRRGVRVDLEAAERARLECLRISEEAFRDLSDKMGQTVGVDEARRNEWLMRAFDAHHLRYPKDNDGRGSFEKKWMEREEHWLPKLLVRGKAYREAADKFLQKYIMDFAHLGRLHASINQFRSEEGGTRTSRFSYADPPLQQMPHRNEELARMIRGAFLPEEDEWWFSADYSQQEYRLIVHYAFKSDLEKADVAARKYREDPATDFHQMVSDMTGLARKPAKDTNFAKSYGAGVKKFASMINRSENEARMIMEQYDREMPFVAKLNEMCQKKAEKSGYVKLLDGARVHFETWEPAWLSKEERARGWSSGGAIKMGDCRLEEAQSRAADKTHPWYGKKLRRAHCRKAMNSLIQGGAARQTKMAMRECWRAGFVPLLQMHDELAFSFSKKSDGDRAAEIMRDVVRLLVPMKVDGEWGPNWGDAVHDKPPVPARKPRK